MATDPTTLEHFSDRQVLPGSDGRLMLATLDGQAVQLRRLTVAPNAIAAARQQLAAAAQMLALAHTVTGQPGAEAFQRWRALTLRWSGSFGLRFPSALLCTGIEQVAEPDRRQSRARSPPR